MSVEITPINKEVYGKLAEAFQIIDQHKATLTKEEIAQMSAMLISLTYQFADDVGVTGREIAPICNGFEEAELCAVYDSVKGTA